MLYSYKNISQDLKKNIFSNIYFLMGEESFLIDKIINFFSNNFIKEEHKSFDQEIFYGKETDIITIINRCRRFPMMSNKQLIIVKEAQNLSFFTKAKDKDLEIFNQYLLNPSKETHLIFAYKNKVLDKRKKITKEIINNSIVLNTEEKENKIYENQLPDWIKNEVQLNQYSIDKKAILILIDNIGNNLTKITNELNKIYINKKNDTLITTKDIEKYVGINREYNLFELQDSLINKDTKRAMKIIKYFESNSKTNPIQKIILFLFNFYSKLLFVLSYKNQDSNKISQLLKIHPFAAKSYLKGINNYTFDEVKKNIKYCKEIDLISKGINYNSNKEGVLLKELIYKMIYA